MTVRRAALIAALIAGLAYLPALGNRFALDDGAIVERNAAAHSIVQAAGAFTQPYWPPENGAGLWRPLVILSFAVDWQLSHGSPVWLHAVNVLMHAAATGLVVAVIAPYVSVAGALAGGVLFAIHPLHVEAVANLVGRAELLVAALLMLALLTARAVRARVPARDGRGLALEAQLCVLVALALLSKEHAAIAVALLWLDDRAQPDRPGRLPTRDLVIVGVLTAAWLLARRQVEGGLSFQAVAPTFFHLGTVGRISTMLPVVFVLLRLFVWPFDLSPDYHPLVIERLEHPTLIGAFGLVVLVSVVLLALLLWRRHRTASLGLLVIGLAWLPTANLLFPAGIVLAERTLYLPSVGLALLVAAAADAILGRAGNRHGGLLLVLCAVPLLARTVTRIPDWRSTRDLVVTALLEHPESYKVHQSAARVYLRLGLRPQALTEYGVAAEIYPLDHYLLAEIASGMLEAGNLRLAHRYLVQAEALDSNYSLTQQLLAQAYLEVDSPSVALVHARRAVRTGPPDKAEPTRMLAASFLALGMPDSAVAVWPAFLARGGNRFDRWLLGSVTLAAVGRGPDALLALDSAISYLPRDTIAIRRLEEGRAEVIRRVGGRP